MDLQAFELAVREVAYVSVLMTGALVLAGATCATLVWSLKQFMRFTGMYAQFVRFKRTYRRRR